jgi:hypothetical protein
MWLKCLLFPLLGIDHLLALECFHDIHTGGGKVESFISFCGGKFFFILLFIQTYVRNDHGPNIYKETKFYVSAFLKNLPVKVLGGGCLSV